MKESDRKESDRTSDRNDSDRMFFLNQLFRFKDMLGFRICKEKAQNIEINRLYESLIILILNEFEKI